jgi:hypothetical protein
MLKEQIRTLKSHYLARWAVMRHNQKNKNKVLLLEDQFVIKNLLSGTTLCYNCLGEAYQGIIDLGSNKKYNNLVLINNLEFKYKTVDQINLWLQELADDWLLPGGRIIFSVEHKFLIYNRIEISVDTLLSTWFINVNHVTVLKSVNLLGKTNPGYGDYFFCIEYNHE